MYDNSFQLSIHLNEYNRITEELKGWDRFHQIEKGDTSLSRAVRATLDKRVKDYHILTRKELQEARKATGIKGYKNVTIRMSKEQKSLLKKKAKEYQCSMYYYVISVLLTSEKVYEIYPEEIFGSDVARIEARRNKTKCTSFLESITINVNEEDYRKIMARLSDFNDRRGVSTITKRPFLSNAIRAISHKSVQLTKKVHPSGKKESKIVVNMTKKQKETILEKAYNEYMSVSDYIVSCLLTNRKIFDVYIKSEFEGNRYKI